MTISTTHSNWTRLLFVRALESLVAELRLYPDDATIWQTTPGILNPAGTIALHLCGNLQHFVGAILGGTGYVRARDLEFSQRDIPRAALIAEIEKTIEVVNQVMSELPDSALLVQYPDVLGGMHITCGLWLQHLSVHAGYHLGQVGYLRRMLTSSTDSIEALGMKVLDGH
ncbi:MAG: DUF1572 family protein [bacterium]